MTDPRPHPLAVHLIWDAIDRYVIEHERGDANPMQAAQDAAAALTEAGFLLPKPISEMSQVVELLPPKGHRLIRRRDVVGLLEGLFR